MEYSFQNLIKLVEEKTGFKCGSYKEKPLTRRIRVRMRALGLTDFSQYYDYLTNNPEEFTKLLDTLTIKLSYFFRNSETFEYLKDEIMPRLARNEQIKIWSAGCAQGEEPYSLAIIAAESNLLEKLTVYATDIDEHALTKAREGIYPSVVFQYTPKPYIEKYFIKCPDGYQIKDNLKSVIQFSHLDLFDDFPFGKCNLIMCRNVLIYMDRRAQSTLVRKFYETLKAGGYLVIGKVELLLGIPEAKLFEIVNRSERVYQRIDN
ncbi:MAG: protein-glutamate O-methyltransferase CheR [candidate division WOR-3 bacterium]